MHNLNQVDLTELIVMQLTGTFKTLNPQNYVSADFVVSTLEAKLESGIGKRKSKSKVAKNWLTTDDLI